MNDILLPRPISIYVISIRNGSVAVNASLHFTSGINVIEIINRIVLAPTSTLLGNIIPESISATGRKIYF